MAVASWFLAAACNGRGKANEAPEQAGGSGGSPAAASDTGAAGGPDASEDATFPGSGGARASDDAAVPGAGGARTIDASGGTGGATNDGGADAMSPGVRWLGRVDTSDPSGARFAWSGTGFAARFSGTSLSVTLDNTAPIVFKAVVDGAPQAAFTAAASRGSYVLATGLRAGTHEVALYRQTEGVLGESRNWGVAVGEGVLLDPPPAPTRLIEAVGASVTCGYGNLGTSPCSFTIETESHWDTYAAIAARALGADLDAVSISGRGVLRNSDGTTDGTMPKLYDRIFPDRATPAWDFHKSPQVVIINLGRNDFGVGDPGLAFRDAYADFARALRARHSSALIVCTTGPNLGEPNHTLQLGYVEGAIAIRRGEGDDNIELVDWPEMTANEIGCDFHPTAGKHQLMADQVTAVIHAKLGW
jgi:lysophospholipase L1-like esterase